MLGIAVFGLFAPNAQSVLVAGAAAAVACAAAGLCMLWTGWRARGVDRRWRVALGIATLPTIFVSAWHVRWIVDHQLALPAYVPWPATLFLAVVVVNLVGILLFPSDPLETETDERAVPWEGYHWYAITALDSLLLVDSMFLLTWATVLGASLGTRHVNTAGIVANTGALIGDLILLAACLLLATFRQPRSGRALALLAAGMGAMAVSTASYLTITASGGHRSTPIVDVIATAGWLMLLLASLVPVPGSPPSERRSGSQRTLRLRALLPYVALGTAGLLVVGQLIAKIPIDNAERAGLIGLLLLVIVRQMMIQSENTRLLKAVQISRRQLRYQAFHDPLTGLANRALFTERVRAALAHRGSQPFALVYCDLDNFKQVNDTFGHAVGDALLRTTADRLRAGVRPVDTVARLGGDEFAILLDDRNEDPRRFCERLADAIRAPTLLADRLKPVGVSLGVVVADGDRPADPDALLHDADLAMYAAKRQAGGGLVVYEPGRPDRGCGAGGG
ncbi:MULTISPECIES: GGDEF domain-containing protein [unclassified Frankia]|uniref:GGDEF domain-containing protein n=1 Tax=unclassified Frankia TaxID=2632575 RepID=UPI0027DE5925|nr:MULTISPECIES: GGDEF domain-containing protein [unclassified Frankia]